MGPVIRISQTSGFNSHVATRSARLRRDQIFTDFTLSLPDRNFHCHRYVLSLHSPILHAMMTSGMVESTQGVASIKNIKPEVMGAILDYMYLGEVSFEARLLMDVASACDYLAISHLLDACIDKIQGILNPSNVISWLHFAKDRKLTEIERMCKELMLKDFVQVSREHGFLELSKQELESYVRCVMRSVSKSSQCENVVQAVMRWVQHCPEERRFHLADLLQWAEIHRCSLSSILHFINDFRYLIEEDEATKNYLIVVINEKTERNIPPPEIKETSRTLVIVGGERGDQLGDEVNRMCWSLNPDGEFKQLFRIPSVLSTRHSACKTPYGFAVTGGVDSDLCATFNTQTETWIRLRSLPRETYGHGSICIRSILSVIGGGPSGELSKEMIGLDLERPGNWTTGPSLPIDVAFPKLTEMDDVTYLFDEDTKKLFSLEVGGQRWIELSTLPTDEDCIGVSMASTPSGLLCVAGGFSKLCTTYNPCTDLWTTLEPLNGCHFYGALVCLDGRLLMLGGDNDNAESEEIEEIDVELGVVTASEMEMPRNLWRHHAFVVDVQCV